MVEICKHRMPVNRNLAHDYRDDLNIIVFCVIFTEFITLTGIPVEALFSKRYGQILIQIDNLFQMTKLSEFNT